MPLRPRRRFPRAPVDRPALVRVMEPDPFRESFEDFARTRTLGAGGCMFESREPIGYGSLALVLISLGDRVVQADGKVVYENPRRDGALEVGVEFLRLRSEDRQTIEQLVAREATRGSPRRAP